MWILSKSTTYIFPTIISPFKTEYSIYCYNNSNIISYEPHINIPILTKKSPFKSLIQDTNITYNRSAWVVPIIISLRTFLIYLERLLTLDICWKPITMIHIFSFQAFSNESSSMDLQSDTIQFLDVTSLRTHKLTLPLSVTNDYWNHLTWNTSIMY